MKIWYLTNENTMDSIVGYGETPQEVLVKCVKSRPTIDLDNDISHWSAEEFTPNDYDGCLLFY